MALAHTIPQLCRRRSEGEWGKVRRTWYHKPHQVIRQWNAHRNKRENERGRKNYIDLVSPSRKQTVATNPCFWPPPPTGEGERVTVTHCLCKHESGAHRRAITTGQPGGKNDRGSRSALAFSRASPLQLGVRLCCPVTRRVTSMRVAGRRGGRKKRKEGEGGACD